MNSDYYNKKINLAGLTIDTYTGNSFRNIRDFLDRFSVNDFGEGKNAKYKVYFSKGNRKVELSDNWNSLSIAGDDIDDLHNPFNLIGITQALFRFVAIHLAQRGIFLLHGSTSVLDEKVICFGDDGSSTAKTLGSLEVALDSKLYIADEFCFFNSQNKEVFGYRFIPIHIRPIVKEHLESHHRFTIPKSRYKQTSAGKFVEQDNLFSTTSGKLAALAYIHFSEEDHRSQKLSVQEAIKAFSFCITSHIAKLLYPKLDRMQFSSMTDTGDAKVISEEIVNEILNKIVNNSEEMIQRTIEQIPSYRLTVSQPCQITTLLRKAIY
jgi:hypothetical protein